MLVIGRGSDASASEPVELSGAGSDQEGRCGRDAELSEVTEGRRSRRYNLVNYSYSARMVRFWSDNLEWCSFARIGVVWT